MKNIQRLIFLSIFIFACSDSEELSLLENESPQEKELKAFLDNPLGFNKGLNQDFAILKFEQSYFEEDPFLTLTTRIKNSSQLNKQSVLNKSLLEERNGMSFFKFPKIDVSRFKNVMSYQLDEEKVDFIDIEPIRMTSDKNINRISEGQLIEWKSSPTKNAKVLILVKYNLQQLIDDGMTKVGDKHPYTTIVVNDTGTYNLSKRDLSLFERGSAIEFILVRGEYYQKEIGQSKMYVGSVSLYHSDTFIRI